METPVFIPALSSPKLFQLLLKFYGIQAKTSSFSFMKLMSKYFSKFSLRVIVLNQSKRVSSLVHFLQRFSYVTCNA